MRLGLGLGLGLANPIPNPNPNQVSVVIDGLTYGPAVTISPPQYWQLFGGVAAAAPLAAAEQLSLAATEIASIAS